MAASYKKLFKLLIDREMKSKELAAKAGISPATLAKMKKDGATVSSATARHSRGVCHRQEANAPRSSSACGRFLLGNPLDGKLGVHL